MKIQSVQRAVNILGLFSLSQPQLGVTEIARKLGLNKGTAWGLVTTLESNGLLDQDPKTSKYGLGPKVFEMGLVYVGGLSLNRVAAGPAQRLADSTRLTVWMGIWDGSAILVTNHSLPQGSAKTADQIGPKLAAHCSSVGKAALAHLPLEELTSWLDRAELAAFTPSTITDPQTLLADLEETRRRGYALSREESLIGQAGLGAPVFNAAGDLAGVIGVAGRPARKVYQREAELADELIAAAYEISQSLGYQPQAAKALGA